MDTDSSHSSSPYYYLWCVTIWYKPKIQQTGEITICDNQSEADHHVYQYLFSNDTRDWFYRGSDNKRQIRNANNTLYLSEIRFSVKTEEIDDAYAYVVETGEIFFAGKNTPYYGYTNLNQMPTE